jgi:hypothetical protein
MRRRRRQATWGALLLALVAVAAVRAGVSADPTQTTTTHTYTVSWNHDGTSTDGYAILLDGARLEVTPTCTGAGPARVCAAPLTMTVGLPHTVKVEAFNAFGSAESDPFVCGPPGKPSGVGAKK